MEGLNKLGGRFQTQHLFSNQSTTVDLKGSTGAISGYQFTVFHPRIELMWFQYVVKTAGGAITINAQVRLNYVPRGGGSTVNGLGTLWNTAGYQGLATGVSTLTFASGASAPVGSRLRQSLNPYYNGIVPTSDDPTGLKPVPGPASFFQAYEGDQIQLELITAGTGAGAQSVVLAVAYREVPLT